MKPVFVGHPLLAALFVCGLTVWLVIEGPQVRRGRADATTTVRGSDVVLRLCAVAGIGVAALALDVRAAAFEYSPITFSGVMGCGNWACGGGPSGRWGGTLRLR